MSRPTEREAFRIEFSDEAMSALASVPQRVWPELRYDLCRLAVAAVGLPVDPREGAITRSLESADHRVDYHYRPRKGVLYVSAIRPVGAADSDGLAVA